MNKKIEHYEDVISQEKISLIKSRHNEVAKAIIAEFWKIQIKYETIHSFYVGSYGRNTAVDTSDIDILIELPENIFNHYNKGNGNVQSRLLQTIKNAVLNICPGSDIRADGQVVKIDFADGIKFEIIPAFRNDDGIYKYPDSNNGGKWRSANPIAEQKAMAEKDNASKGLLCDTCRHIRAVHDACYSGYNLKGIVIDSFVYEAIGNYCWAPHYIVKSPEDMNYERNLLEYYYNHGISVGKNIHAPGSNDLVPTEASYQCLEKVLKYIAGVS